MARRRKKKSKAPLTTLAVAVVALAVAFCWHFFDKSSGFVQVGAPVAGDVAVYYVDVGQGDCEIIRDHDKTVLIDAGENDQGERVLQKLQKLGVDKVDIAIGTHPHSDHIGGMDTVIRGMQVDTLILPDVPASVAPTTKTYTEVLQAADERGVSVQKAQQGQSYPLSQGTLSILGPVGTGYTELNSWSVPAKFTCGQVAFLFCGDMEKDAEQDLLQSGQDLHANVFKLNHHGSKTSNSEAFLQAVGAQAYTIEVGMDNQYNLPNDKVLARLGGAPVYRTDLNGTITFTTDGATYGVEVEKGGK